MEKYQIPAILAVEQTSIVKSLLLLLEQLRERDAGISSGQINQILTCNKDDFHQFCTKASFL